MSDCYCYIQELQKQIKKLSQRLECETDKRRKLDRELEECVAELRRESCQNRACIQELQRSLAQFACKANGVAHTQNKAAQQLCDAASQLRSIQCCPPPPPCSRPCHPEPKPCLYPIQEHHKEDTSCNWYRDNWPKH